MSYMVWLSLYTTLLSKPSLGLTFLAAPTPALGPCLRHRDDTEVQPVPGVPEECEVINAEASGQHLNKRLESVDPSEGVPGKKRASQGHRCHLDTCVCARTHVCMAVVSLRGGAPRWHMATQG